MTKKAMFSRYVFISIIIEIFFIVVNFFFTGSLLQGVTYILILNGILSLDVYRNIYEKNTNNKQMKRSFFIYYPILSIIYIIYVFNFLNHLNRFLIFTLILSIIQLFYYLDIRKKILHNIF